MVICTISLKDHFIIFGDFGLCQMTNLQFILYKVGGLDVETNRDRDRERPSCQDKLF
jgi:hypothetical protein